MNRIGMLAAALMVSCAGAGALRGERVLLKAGHEITGEILKADKNVVVVDVGCTVIRLARSDVVRIVKGGPATGPAAATAPAERASAKWRLYRTGRLERTTIEKNTERFGGAVIMVTSPAGQGSGFIITPDGYCVTNYHVIANETRIKVTVFKKTDRGFEQTHYKKVKIIALNPFVDLALLKIQAEKESFKFAYLGKMAAIEAGQQVFAIGNPLGLTRTVSQGIVSAKNRNFQGRLYIQTTADINPGNSGGPLFNLKGEVVGVTSMGYLYLGGLNFAIPVDVVKRFIENRDAFAYDEDNPNAGYRYLQPARRQNKKRPPAGKLPAAEPAPPGKKGGSPKKGAPASSKKAG